VIARIQKWDNSLGLRIPRALAEDADIGEGSPVDISVRRGSLVVRPVRREEYRLEDLLDEVRPSNLHDEVEVSGPWSRDGSELFYRGSGGQLMAVSVLTDPSFEFGNPETLFEEPYHVGASSLGRTYGISPDGERLLMIKESGESEVQEIIVVLNWFEELKRLVPTN